MKNLGKLIVIDGTDGSGKATQTELLRRRLRREGKRVRTISFPRHGHPSGYMVERYLAGDFGTAAQVGPYRGSMFYALDRYAASFQIRKWLADGDVVISVDADLQDDLDAIGEMLTAYGQGCDVVYGVRSRRDTDRLLSRPAMRSSSSST
ncbi:MAG: hypothetical protein HGA94_00920 [Candidatus Aminicenantes bacterium]|nr:hypothetical protein [Candidatus Aminicenantes bacterium]